MRLENKESSFFDLVRTSYAFFPQLFRQTVWLIVAQYGAMLLTAMVSVFIFASVFVDDVRVAHRDPFGFLWQLGMPSVIFGILFITVIVIVAAVFTTAEFARAYGVLYKNDDFIEHTWRITKVRFMHVVGFVALTSLLFMPFMLTGFFFTDERLVKILYFILFLLVGAYFWIRFYLVVPLIISFNYSIWEALKTSEKMTTGRFDRTVGVLCVVVALPMFAFGAVEFVLSRGGLVFDILAFIVQIIGHIVLTVLTLSAVYVLFNDYQARHALKLHEEHRDDAVGEVLGGEE